MAATGKHRLFRGILKTSCISLIALSAHAAHAQSDNTENRLVIRSAGIAGVAPIAIDLNKTSTQRYALIIGNGDYENVADLPNAVADSRLVAQTLRQSDYTVAEHYNLDKQGFEAAMRQMLYEAEQGAEILVYYAGHGVQVGGRNYILPTDSAVTSVYDLPFQTVSLQGILALAASRARSVVAILDSCRDNPFPDKKLSVDLDGVPASVRSGFNPQESPINSLIVFSTAPGSVALDGEGANSPFTTAMVEAITNRPEASFDDLLKDIRRAVYERTNQLQLPWQSSSLVEPVYLARRSAANTWDEVTTNEVNVAEEPVDPIEISAMLDPKVEIGAPLGAVPANGQDVALLSYPANGRIEVDRGGQLVTVPERSGLRASDLGNLYYRPDIQGARKGADPFADVRDQFQVQTAGQRHAVSVTLQVDPCDRQAGDHLDPEGVGIAIYPNEIDVRAALAACRAAVEAHPANGRYHYQLGRAHFAQRDLDAAQAAYQRAADLGHTRAYQALGLLEIAKSEATQGRLSGRASPRAMEYFAAGVERGDPYAYHSMGLQLLRHPASENEQLQGFELLSRALELGHTFSMNALGLYFLDEAAAHYDPLRGLRYLQGSAAREDIYGIANLGYVYANGLAGEDKDARRARILFERAADEGHPTAPTSLGRLFVSGDLPGGVNNAEAIRWYDIGLSRGDGWGGANAAWIIANRRPAGFALHDAAVRAAKAATLRNPAAQAAAQEVLANLPRTALDGGAQALMRELGVGIEVDGAFGPNSRAKLDTLARETARAIPEDRLQRLLTLSAMVWERSRFRVDLY